MNQFDPTEVLKDVISDINVLFVSFRLNHEKKDGVSLEVLKWAKVLNEGGASIYYYSGETVIPEKYVKDGKTFERAHFLLPDITYHRDRMFKHGKLYWDDFKQIVQDEKIIRGDLRKYLIEKKIDVVIAENVLAYPGNVALSLAVVNSCNELGIKVIAHNHDFWFERERFQKNTQMNLKVLLNEILRGANKLYTCTINQKQVQLINEVGGFEGRVIVVPNLMDFGKKDEGLSEKKMKEFKKDYGVLDDETIVLLPVRPVPRKELHLAVDVCEIMERKLGYKLKVMVTHPAGDEGMDYWNSVKEYFKKKNISLLYKPELDEKIQKNKSSEFEKWSLEDCYRACDIVLYTSSLEGFGNALIEAVYFKKPVIINPYDVYVKDIKTKGINCVELETILGETEDKYKFKVEKINEKTEEKLISEIKNMMENKDSIINENYRVGEIHFSYDTLRTLFIKVFLNLYRNKNGGIVYNEKSLKKYYDLMSEWLTIDEVKEMLSSWSNKFLWDRLLGCLVKL